MAAARRTGLGPRLALGVRALDLFTPCREGQRMGVFAGSGVGKSTLTSMIARGAEADVLVVGLVGERGRELNEFLEHTLGPEGRAAASWWWRRRTSRR
jgi:flagellum-specific ATP synthase